MTDVEDKIEAIDGRVARRQRNIDAVIDVVLEMFAEDAMFPTIEQAATRSGLSLRSLYRYFADPAELLEAAIKRGSAEGNELARLHAIGQGPLDSRIEDFVAMRLRLHEAIGPRYRATIANASRHVRVRDELAKNRNDMREQFALQFDPELANVEPGERDAVLAAGDLLSQLDSIEYLRRHRQLSIAETKDVLTVGLRSLFER